jgi:hypothetical protein
VCERAKRGGFWGAAAPFAEHVAVDVQALQAMSRNQDSESFSQYQTYFDVCFLACYGFATR